MLAILPLTLTTQKKPKQATFLKSFLKIIERNLPGVSDKWIKMSFFAERLDTIPIQT